MQGIFRSATFCINGLIYHEYHATVEYSSYMWVFHGHTLASAHIFCLSFLHPELCLGIPALSTHLSLLLTSSYTRDAVKIVVSIDPPSPSHPFISIQLASLLSASLSDVLSFTYVCALLCLVCLPLTDGNYAAHFVYPGPGASEATWAVLNPCWYISCVMAVVAGELN